MVKFFEADKQSAQKTKQAKPSKAVLTDKFSSFEFYWEFDLLPRLANAEMLVRHPLAQKNTNPLLYILVSSYIQSAIDVALIKIWEVADFLKLKGFSKIELLVKYRNTFVVHKEQMQFLAETVHLMEEVKKGDWKIFSELREGAEALIHEIQKNGSFCTVGRANEVFSVHPLMDEGGISEIIRILSDATTQKGNR